MISQLRAKQNNEAQEYNMAINRRVLDKIHSQVALWESDRPLLKTIDTETINAYNDKVGELLDIIDAKTNALNAIDLSNGGSEKQYSILNDNSQFLNLYNSILKPLTSGGVDKKIIYSITNLIQPLAEPIDGLSYLLKELLNNVKAVDLIHIVPTMVSYTIYNYINNQFNNNAFQQVDRKIIQSHFDRLKNTLGQDINRRINDAFDEMATEPLLRKYAMEAQVGKLSPEEMKGVRTLEGITATPIPDPLKPFGDFGKQSRGAPAGDEPPPPYTPQEVKTMLLDLDANPTQASLIRTKEYLELQSRKTPSTQGKLIDYYTRKINEINIKLRELKEKGKGKKPRKGKEPATQAQLGADDDEEQFFYQ